MSKRNSNIVVSGNIIIEKSEDIILKINQLNSGNIVEVGRSDINELSRATIFSPILNKSDFFLAGVRGFCFFPERPVFSENKLPELFSKYESTAFFNTNPNDFIDFFDFNSGFFDHHYSFASSRCLNIDLVEFTSFSAYRTRHGVLFLDLFFIDDKSCFTLLLSKLKTGESVSSEVFSYDYSLKDIINGETMLPGSSLLIFNTLTSCLMSLISMNYVVFCSDVSACNVGSKLSLQRDNFEKIITNDMMLSGLSDEAVIKEIKDSMFCFFSNVINCLF